MPLTYVQQTQLAKSTAWQDRITAALTDVSLNVLRTLADTVPDAYNLKNLAVDVVRDPDSYTPAVARLVSAAAGPALANLATPIEATGTDAQLRTQAELALRNLVRR